METTLYFESSAPVNPNGLTRDKPRPLPSQEGNHGRHLLLQLRSLEVAQLGVVDEGMLDGELGVVRPVHHLQDDAGDPALHMN